MRLHPSKQEPLAGNHGSEAFITGTSSSCQRPRRFHSGLPMVFSL
jgi:hypothetical protein